MPAGGFESSSSALLPSGWVQRHRRAGRKTGGGFLSSSAAQLSGLGTIGRNHCLLTEEFDFSKGGASIFTFGMKGNAEKAKRFTEELSLFSLLANVADVKSLVIHPASTTHSQMSEGELIADGIKPNAIRLSIGAEHIDDIIDDLKQGLEAIG